MTMVANGWIPLGPPKALYTEGHVQSESLRTSSPEFSAEMGRDLMENVKKKAGASFYHLHAKLRAKLLVFTDFASGESDPSAVQIGERRTLRDMYSAFSDRPLTSRSISLGPVG